MIVNLHIKGMRYLKKPPVSNNKNYHHLIKHTHIIGYGWLPCQSNCIFFCLDAKNPILPILILSTRKILPLFFCVVVLTDFVKQMFPLITLTRNFQIEKFMLKFLEEKMKNKFLIFNGTSGRL